METVNVKTILQKNKSTDWFGSDYNMKEVMRMHAGTADGILFAGDGCLEFDPPC